MSRQRDYNDFRLSGLWSIPASTAFGLLTLRLQVEAYDIVTFLILFQVLVGVVYTIFWLLYYRSATYSMPDYGFLIYITRSPNSFYFYCLFGFCVCLFAYLFLVIAPNGLTQDIQGGNREVFRGLLAQATAFAFVIMYFFEIVMLSWKILLAEEK